MTRGTPTTSEKGIGKWASRWGHGESATECAGEPASINAHDFYGSSGGSSRGDAMTGGGCTSCVGATLSVACKLCSVLSWYTFDTVGVDSMDMIYTDHICILRVWVPFCTITPYFLNSKGWNIKKIGLRLYLYMLQCVHAWMCFLCLVMWQMPI